MSEIRAPRSAAMPEITLMNHDIPIQGLIPLVEYLEFNVRIFRELKKDPVCSGSFVVGGKESVSLEHVLMVARREGVLDE